jgi:hypothetical protein
LGAKKASDSIRIHSRGAVATADFMTCPGFLFFNYYIICQKWEICEISHLYFYDALETCSLFPNFLGRKIIADWKVLEL